MVFKSGDGRGGSRYSGRSLQTYFESHGGEEGKYNYCQIFIITFIFMKEQVRLVAQLLMEKEV